MSCSCKVGPGKFEGEPAVIFMAWQQAMLGNSDVSTGGEGLDGPLTDWLRSPLNLDADIEVVVAAVSYGYCVECVDEAGKGIDGGVAVWEADNGFVFGCVFETRAEFDAALSEAEAADISCGQGEDFEEDFDDAVS